MTTEGLIPQLRRWANARERRNTPGGHGKTGTDLLRHAAARIEELEEAIRDIRGYTRESWEMIERLQAIRDTTERLIANDDPQA